MKRGSVLGPAFGVAVLAAGLFVGGCGSAPEIDYASIRGLGTSGAPALAAVFSPDGATGATPGWEDSRRDTALGAHRTGPRLATDEWPTDPRPSLRMQRRGRYPTDSRGYLYFQSERDRPDFHRGW